jgi:sialic acid synthase SpsE
MHGSSQFAGYQRERVSQNSAAEMLRRYELSAQVIQRVIEAIRKAGMIAMATPFSVGDVETIERLNLPAIKIASPDLVNRVLLERAAQTAQRFWSRPVHQPLTKFTGLWVGFASAKRVSHSCTV